MKPSPPVLELSGVSLYRGRKKILNDISWTIRRGEHWVILGPNGSGKTSLLEIVMGYNWASEGSVKLLGHPYGKVNLPELRRKLGYVAPWVHRHIRSGETVEHAVSSGLEGAILLTLPLDAAQQKKVTGALQRGGIENLRTAPFGRLSSGEQFKVLMARALVADPVFLILDEAFSALDLGARSELYAFLEREAQRSHGPSLVLVTHHLEDIRPCFTHALLLREGGVIASGRKKDVITSSYLSTTYGVSIEIPAKTP